MKKHFNIFMLAVIALLGLSLTACNNDDLNTDQYGSDVRVQAFGLAQCCVEEHCSSMARISTRSAR